jgi:hypothetical protein
MTGDSAGDTSGGPLGAAVGVGRVGAINPSAGWGEARGAVGRGSIVGATGRDKRATGFGSDGGDADGAGGGEGAGAGDRVGGGRGVVGAGDAVRCACGVLLGVGAVLAPGALDAGPETPTTAPQNRQNCAAASFSPRHRPHGRDDGCGVGWGRRSTTGLGAIGARSCAAPRSPC